MRSHGKLILRKTMETVATRCHMLKPSKCIKFDFSGGWSPDPLGELTALPRPLAGFKGPVLPREGGGMGKDKGGEGRIEEVRG